MIYESKIAGLHVRQIGQGKPIFVLHGGPDFDHTYLLPELDRLADAFHLIYFDQRGRGRSAQNVEPEDVTIQSDVDDLERLRRHFRQDSLTLLGHSWGGLLALEYAVAHPNCVSHLILLNCAPVSRQDYLLFRRMRQQSAPSDLEKLRARSSDPQYLQGDPDTVANYYRIHFRAALHQPEHLEKVVCSLRASFTKEGILKARAIEDRLMDQTWLKDEYDLLPRLKELRIPALLIHGDHDFIPVECSLHIAQAIPGAQLSVLEGCGHFSYLECPDEVYNQITAFLKTDDRD